MPFVIPHLIGKYEAHGFDKFKPRRFVAVDTEGTGLDSWGEIGVDRSIEPARCFMIQLCDEDGNTASVRFPVLAKTRKILYNEEGLALVRRFLCTPFYEKIFHNYSYDVKVVRKAGIQLAGKIHDTLIRMHIINSESGTLKLKELGERYLDIPADDEKALQSSTVRGRALAKKNGWTTSGSVKSDYHLGDEEMCRVYGERDGFRTMALFLNQEEYFIQEPDQRKVYERELKVMHVLDAMEHKGTAVDKANVEELNKFYSAVTVKSKAVIEKIAGKDFNPGSWQQMQKLFFGKLGYEPLSYSFKKGKGSQRGKVWTKCVHCKGSGCKICQSTGRSPQCNGDFLASIGVEHKDDEVLAKDPLAYNLLFNSASSTMMQFVKEYQKLMVWEDGHWVIHPNYRQARVKTARLSCEMPNLQNVASDDSGKKKVDLPYRVREAFIPRKDCLFYIPDYAQIEIWLLALLSKDQAFIDQLAAGGDAHQIVADMIWAKAYDRKLVKEAKAMMNSGTPENKLPPVLLKNFKESKRIRKIAKNLNFCKVYGGGIDKVAFMSDSTVEQARQFSDEYAERFPAVEKYMADTIRFAKRNGFVKTPYDRVYRVDPNFAYRATNYAIQGSAADLMKSAMIGVHGLAQRHFPGKMDLLLQIHDELIIEVNNSINSEKTMRAVTDAMTEDYKFLRAPCRFPVGMKISTERWSKSVEVSL